MSRARRNLISGMITLGLIVGGMAYLFVSSAKESFEYYKHVDEVLAQPNKWRGRHLQMHGFVVPGSIFKRLDPVQQQLEYKFQAVNCAATLEVRYAGVVPDTFKDGAEVVLKGTFTGDRFVASEISAKCPSKYQARPDSAAATLCTRGDHTVTARGTP